MSEQHKVHDRPLNFLENAPWADVINPATSRYASVADMKYLDVEDIWSLDLVHGDRARDIMEKLRSRNDKVAILGQRTEVTAEEAALQMWRALVIFTRASMAGYGNLVAPNAMWVKASDPSFPVQVRPLISLDALGRLVGRTPVISLLSPFEQAKVLDIFSQDNKTFYLGARVRAISPSQAIWSRFWPVLSDRPRPSS